MWRVPYKPAMVGRYACRERLDLPLTSSLHHDLLLYIFPRALWGLDDLIWSNWNPQVPQSPQYSQDFREGAKRMSVEAMQWVHVFKSYRRYISYIMHDLQLRTICFPRVYTTYSGINYASTRIILSVPVMYPSIYIYNFPIRVMTSYPVERILIIFEQCSVPIAREPNQRNIRERTAHISSLFRKMRSCGISSRSYGGMWGSYFGRWKFPRFCVT